MKFIVSYSVSGKMVVDAANKGSIEQALLGLPTEDILDLIHGSFQVDDIVADNIRSGENSSALTADFKLENDIFLPVDES